VLLSTCVFEMSPRGDFWNPRRWGWNEDWNQQLLSIVVTRRLCIT